MNDNAQYLKWLSISYYVAAGLTALAACLPAIHVLIGLAILTHPDKWDFKGDAEPETIGWLLVVIGSTVIVVGWLLASCMVLAGRSIAQRRRWLFCLIIAGICCTQMPLGTALGVCTFLVLLKPEVKAEFQARAVAAA